MLTCLAEFSESLRLGRVDHGRDPTVMGRADIVAFTNRLAHKQRTGKISAWKQVAVARDVRRFLGDIRPLGLTRPRPARGWPARERGAVAPGRPRRGRGRWPGPRAPTQWLREREVAPLGNEFWPHLARFGAGSGNEFWPHLETLVGGWRTA